MKFRLCGGVSGDRLALNKGTIILLNSSPATLAEVIFCACVCIIQKLLGLPVSLCPRHHTPFCKHFDTNGTKTNKLYLLFEPLSRPLFILYSCVSAPLVNCSQAVKTRRISESAASSPCIRNSPVTRSGHSHRLHW